MPKGPGKYDDLATYARQQAGADGVLLIVLGGLKGSGFAVQFVEGIDQGVVPELLRDMAAQIATDVAAEYAPPPPGPTPTQLEGVELYAYVGLDEHGSGAWGLKQAMVPAGMIPLVAIDRAKCEKYFHQMEAQAKRHGKKIRLVRFAFAEVVRETEHGGDE